MNLYHIGFCHYSSKDSREGIDTYLIAESDEQVMMWLSKKAWPFLGDEDTGTLSKYFYERDFPDERERALALGLTIDPEYGDVKGPKRALILLNRGDFEPPSDLYYGHTSWYWRPEGALSEQDAEVLIRLGIAQRV